MQASWRCLLLLALAASAAEAAHSRSQANPLSKVLELLKGLQSKISEDGEKEAKSYHEYFEWCDEVSQNTKHEIETASADKEGLEAKIAKLAGDVEAASAKIDELAGAISKADKELKDATAIRKKEAADFSASEKELMEAVDTLDRAGTILEKEMGSASLAQLNTKSMKSTLAALSTVLDAAGFSGQDQNKLSSFIQAHTASSEDDQDLDADEQPGAPAAAAYESKSGNVLEIIEDMKEKAEGQLGDLRKAEVESKHSYEMLKQSIEDQAGADNDDLAKEKASKAAASEEKASKEGELQVTSKKLDTSTKELATAQSTCMQVAADHEASNTARKEELKALGEATKSLEETTGGAEKQSYSFVQVAAESTRTRSRVLAAVKGLAKKHHSAALAQLASRMASALRYGASTGEDPFAKVKGLITDMVAKLEKEAQEESTEKAYCDEQLAKSGAKNSELEEDIGRMTAKIDKAVAASAKLKEQIKDLEGELASLAKEQAEMDSIRLETHEDYLAAKADLEKGLTGVRQALGVLRDYYAAESGASAAASMLQDDASFGAFMRQPAPPAKHGKAAGAGGSIIGILEVIESDFATNLAKEESKEADFQMDFEKMTQENKVTKATKEQDVKYKVQETKSLDKTTAELTGDKDTALSELSAVDEYLSQLKDRCVAKPESYEVRKKRRQAEIDGLKEALQTLEDEAAFMQRGRRGRAGRRGAARQHGHLRGGDLSAR